MGELPKAMCHSMNAMSLLYAETTTYVIFPMHIMGMTERCPLELELLSRTTKNKVGLSNNGKDLWSPLVKIDEGY